MQKCSKIRKKYVKLSAVCQEEELFIIKCSGVRQIKLKAAQKHTIAPNTRNIGNSDVKLRVLYNFLAYKGKIFECTSVVVWLVSFESMVKSLISGE